MEKENDLVCLCGMKGHGHYRDVKEDKEESILCCPQGSH